MGRSCSQGVKRDQPCEALETGHAGEEEARRDYGKAKSSLQENHNVPTNRTIQSPDGVCGAETFWLLNFCFAATKRHCELGGVGGDGVFGWMDGRIELPPKPLLPTIPSVARHSSIIWQRSLVCRRQPFDNVCKTYFWSCGTFLVVVLVMDSWWWQLCT